MYSQIEMNFEVEENDFLVNQNFIKLIYSNSFTNIFISFSLSNNW